MADSESIKKMLRSVLQSSKNGVSITSLQAEYRSLCGETIPLKRLGFSSLEDYVRSIPSVVRLEYRQGSLVCFAAVCKETAHIAELVARQKNSKKAGRSQVVNCKMRFKPSNLFALNVKPKTCLRQPSNWSNWTTNRRPAQGYGGFSASGDVRKLDPRWSSVVPVQQRTPVTQQPVRPNNLLENKENGFQVNHRPPVKSPTRETAPTQVNKDNIQIQIQPIDFNLELEQSRLSQVLNTYNSGLWMSKLEAVYSKMFSQHPHPRTLQELEKWTHICSLEKPSITNRADRLIYPPLPPTKSPATYRNTNGPVVSPKGPVSTPLSSRLSTREKPQANVPAPFSVPIPKPRVPRINLAKPTFVFPPETMGDGLPMVSLRSPALNPELAPQFMICGFGDSPNFSSKTSGQVPLFQPSPPGQAPLVQPPQTPVAASASTISEYVRQKVKELLLKYSSGLWVQAVPKLFEDTYKMPLPEHALDDLSLWVDICDVEYPLANDKKKAILYYSGRDEFEPTEERAHPLPSGLEVVGSTAPPPLPLPLEQYPSVLITDAKGSNAVTVRYVGKNYSNAQEAMEEAMRSFYGERLTGYSVSKVTIGQLVAVKGEDEDEVARAQVTDVIDPQKVKVYYLDYGCSLETSTHNLRELHQDFLSLPFQAINVKLAGLEHFSSHPSVLYSLEKLVVGKILLMETLEPCQHSEVPLVVLYDTSQDEDININSSCLKALQDETMNNPLTINVTYQDVNVTNVSADGIIYCQLPSRGMARLTKLLEETEAFFKSQVTSESLVSRPFSGKLCLARYKGKWSRVEVINIYGNRVLEILLIDFGVTMTIEVIELREIPPPLLKDLIIIPPQAIKCSLEDVQVPDGGWSPEAVKWVKEVILVAEAAKMKIRKLGHHKGNRLVYMQLFIGDSLEVENSISHQLAQSELWQKLLTEHINNSMTDTGLSALVEKLTLNSSGPFGNINPTTTGLEKEDVSVKYASPKTDSLSMPPLLDLPQCGQNMDVFVPVACHPGYFVLQPWQDLHKLVVLMGEMVLYYNKTSKTSSQTEINKGEVYAAKVDKNWHRVLVKGMLSNGLISIYELDHGKHELVRSNAIQPLIEEFRQLPFQAVTAQLAGLSRHQWSEEASMVFRNHVEKRALVAQVDSVQEAPDARTAPWERRFTVYLVDTTMENRDLWIHTMMADMGGELTTAA